MVAGKGFEPLKHCAADLQSVPFGHSGNPPYAESAQLDYQMRRYFRKRRFRAEFCGILFTALAGVPGFSLVLETAEAIAGTTDFNLDSAVVSAVTFIKLLVNAIYAVEILSECGEIGRSC